MIRASDGGYAKRRTIHRGKVRAILGVARSFWIRARTITISRWAPERTGTGPPAVVRKSQEPDDEGSGRYLRSALEALCRTIRKRAIPVGRQWSITRKGKEIGVKMMWSRQMPDGHLQICGFISKIH